MSIKKKLEHILKHNQFIQTCYRYSMSGVFRLLGLFVRTDDKLVLMNGHGFKYNDSPRAIYEKMLELGIANQYHIVWALHDPMQYDIPGNCQRIRMDTLTYFITALKAKYWISCVNIERGLHFKKKNTVYLNTWHGASINLCGNAVSNRKDFHFEHIDYFCICSEFERDYVIRDFNIRSEAVLPCGYPRNDELYAATSETVAEYRKMLGIPENKKVIVYAPTWRDSNDGGASYQLAPPIDWKKWQEKLGDKYVVLLRTHPYTTKLMNVVFDDFVRDFTAYPNVNHMLIVADVLISDYSSISLDYSILGKPLICFGYDYEDYVKARGFYFDMEKVFPGGVVRDEDTVIERLMNMDYEAASSETRKFRDGHMELGGNATLTCINKVFGTNY